MPVEPVFTNSDNDAIVNAISYMMEHKNVPRMDIDLYDGKKGKVYWAGMVLRIDIEGLK